MITDFEKFNLEFGDFVIWEPEQWLPRPARNLLKNKIAKIVKIRKDLGGINIDFGGNIGSIMNIEIDNIEYWSKNKKDCETYLAAKKYNI